MKFLIVESSHLCIKKLNLWPTAPKGATPVNFTSATDWQIAVRRDDNNNNNNNNKDKIKKLKIKSVIYSSQGSHPGQLHFCNWLAGGITTG